MEGIEYRRSHTVIVQDADQSINIGQIAAPEPQVNALRPGQIKAADSNFQRHNCHFALSIAQSAGGALNSCGSTKRYFYRQEKFPAFHCFNICAVIGCQIARQAHKF